MELRSSHELLAWLTEVSASSRCGAMKRGEHLLSLATGEGKVPRPPGLFSQWLYELRDSGSIAFGADGNPARTDVHLIRDIAVTPQAR